MPLATAGEAGAWAAQAVPAHPYPDASDAQRDDLRILLINDAVTFETGYTQADVVGRVAPDLPLLADAASIDLFEKALAGKERTAKLDLRLRTKEGHTLECLVSVEAVQIRQQACVLLVSQNRPSRSWQARSLPVRL